MVESQNTRGLGSGKSRITMGDFPERSAGRDADG